MRDMTVMTESKEIALQSVRKLLMCDRHDEDLMVIGEGRSCRDTVLQDLQRRKIV